MEPQSADDPVTLEARRLFGISYLYPYQRLAVHNILAAAGYWGKEETGESPGDQVVLLPTGAGKSLCFQLPAQLLTGLTVVVYPLLSLMADQKRRLDSGGLGCRVLRGGQTTGEREEVWSAVRRGEVRLLLTNPETLSSEAVIESCRQAGVVHLVIDEAHCAAEWGETFRPSYLELAEVRRRLDPAVTTAFTATASPLVLERVIGHIFGGRSPHIISADPDRPNISYRVLPVLSRDEALAEILKSSDKPAVVFCRSRRGAEMTSRYLRRRLCSREIYFYHAGLEREEKKAVEAWFFESRTGILAATCAYGMGIDKSDIRTVIHRDIPGSVEAYLQESGRAGRDGKQSEAILLYATDEPAGDSRAEAMIEYARSTDCRRTRLLSLLGFAAESCSGCDICDGTAVRSPPGEEAILGLIRRNRRRYTEEDAAMILSGARDYRTAAGELRGIKNFGSLCGWEEKGIIEALGGLIRSGRLRGARFPFRSRRLTL